MTAFNYGAWHEAKADFALDPLPADARQIVDRILSGDGLYFVAANALEIGVLRRLAAAGLVDEDDGEFRVTRQLCAASERGYIGELFA